LTVLALFRTSKNVRTLAGLPPWAARYVIVLPIAAWKSEVIPAAIPATTIDVPRGGQSTPASALLSQIVTAKGER
jgi:hypothetical protein